MALYHHVGGKDALLQAVAARLMAELQPQLPEGPWQQRLRAWAVAVRRHFLKYPVLLGLIGWRAHISSAWLAQVALLALVLGRAGFADEALADAVQWTSATLFQAPDVPVYRQGRRENQYENKIREAAKQMFATGVVVKLEAVTEQLKRTSIHLDLPAPKTLRLSSRELCAAARRSHLRVGWVYLCDKCDHWHVNLAGGYVLTADGAVATCYHVVQPDKAIKDGCLVAADEDGTVFPVTEILAAHHYSDACILRVELPPLPPLPLNTNVWPGDVAYCYSDPLDHRGYFSAGIVNRFYQFPGRRRFSAPAATAYAPTRLNVSTDWAPGSSGSAVLDEWASAPAAVSRNTCREHSA